MAASAQFLLTDSFNWDRAEELQRKQLDKTTSVERPPEAQNIKGHSYVDVLVGSMPFTAESDSAHVPSLTGMLYFYRRHVFYSGRSWKTGEKYCNQMDAVPMYGLCVAEAFALQHNVNDDSERQWLDGDSTRCELVHRLLKRRQPVANPKHVLTSCAESMRSARWRFWTVDGFVRAAGKKHTDLSFDDAANAVVFFNECPVQRNTATTETVAKKKRGKKAGRRTSTKRPVFKTVTVNKATVRDTPYKTLKLIFEATGDSVGHVHDGEKEELIDYDSCGRVTIRDLCRQLMGYELGEGHGRRRKLDLSLLSRTAKEPTRTRRQEQHEHWKKHGYVVLDELRKDDHCLDHLPLHLLQIIELRSFSVKEHLDILFDLLENIVKNSKVAKRYRFKDRRHGKNQTDKTVGKARLVKQHMLPGGGWRGNYYPVGNSSDGSKYWSHDQYSKKHRRFWQKRLAQPDYVFGGPRTKHKKPKKARSCLQLMQERIAENAAFACKMRAKRRATMESRSRLLSRPPRCRCKLKCKYGDADICEFQYEQRNTRIRKQQKFAKGGLAKYNTRMDQEACERLDREAQVVKETRSKILRQLKKLDTKVADARAKHGFGSAEHKEAENEWQLKNIEARSAGVGEWQIKRKMSDVFNTDQLLTYRHAPTAPAVTTVTTVLAAWNAMHAAAHATARSLLLLLPTFSSADAQPPPTEWSSGDEEEEKEDECAGQSDTDSEDLVEDLLLFDRDAIDEVEQERVQVEEQQANPLASLASALATDDL